MIGLNNPFNIRYNSLNRWIGSSGHTKGFVNFTSIYAGIRAAYVLVARTYRINHILTVSEIINRFAPPTENNTDKYVDFVCSKLGCFPFDVPDRKSYIDLLVAMSVFEGNPVSRDQILLTIDIFNLKPYKCN